MSERTSPVRGAGGWASSAGRDAAPESKLLDDRADEPVADLSFAALTQPFSEEFRKDMLGGIVVSPGVNPGDKVVLPN